MRRIVEAISPLRATSADDFWKKAGIQTLVLAVVCITNFLFFLGYPGLFDIDEGMHAAIAKGMVLSGEWVTPVFNGEPFFDKPALYNWLVATSFVVFGFTEFAARFPSALLGSGCIFITFAIGRRFLGNKAGFFAAIVLATSLLFHLASRMVLYDIPFTFFTTLSLYFLCDALFGRQRRSAFLAFYAAMGLSVLTKGLLGIAIPGLAIGAFLLWTRDFARIKDFRPVSGAMVIAAIVLPWYVLMELENPGYIEYFVVDQHLAYLLGNVGDTVGRHPQPVYYHVVGLLLGMFPWSFLLPVAVYETWLLRKREAQAPAIFLLFWLVCTLALFSSASSKLITYILPLYPVAALLLGKYIADKVDAPQQQKGSFTASLAVPAAILLLAATWVLANGAPEQLREETGFEWIDIRVAVVAPMLLAVLAFWFAWRRRLALSFAVTSAVMPVFLLLVYTLLVPDVFAYRSSAQISATYESLLSEDELLVFSDKMFDAAIFYTGRDARVLRGREELRDYLKQDRRVYILALTDSDSLVDCEPGLVYRAHLLGNRQVLSNRATNPYSEDLPALPEIECRSSRN